MAASSWPASRTAWPVSWTPAADRRKASGQAVAGSTHAEPGGEKTTTLCTGARTRSAARGPARRRSPGCEPRCRRRRAGDPRGPVPSRRSKAPSTGTLGPPGSASGPSSRRRSAEDRHRRGPVAGPRTNRGMPAEGWRASPRRPVIDAAHSSEPRSERRSAGGRSRPEGPAARGSMARLNCDRPAPLAARPARDRRTRRRGSRARRCSRQLVRAAVPVDPAIPDPPDPGAIRKLPQLIAGSSIRPGAGRPAAPGRRRRGTPAARRPPGRPSRVGRRASSRTVTRPSARLPRRARRGRPAG